ncbi:hypothetical protein ACFX2I_001217 [Malus domestica]
MPQFSANGNKTQLRILGIFLRDMVRTACICLTQPVRPLFKTSKRKPKRYRLGALFEMQVTSLLGVSQIIKSFP